MAADLKTKEKLAKQDAQVQEAPKSHKGQRTRASGDRTWRWAWNPQGGHLPSSGAHQGVPGLYGGASVVEGEKGGGKGRGSRGGGLGRQ